MVGKLYKMEKKEKKKSIKKIIIRRAERMGKEFDRLSGIIERNI